MKTTIAVAALLAAAAARESRIPAGGAALYARAIGSGPAIVVIHGGPDFDSSYFLPDLDGLADGYRLLYYDQRGRGKSADGVKPADVSLESEMSDLDAVRGFYHAEAPTLLGHSWGAVLALEYALRHPDHISRLIIMSPAPASTADATDFRAARQKTYADGLARMKAIADTDAYKRGDPDAVAARYRIHFAPAFARGKDLDAMIARMKVDFANTDVVKARQVEDRLYEDTWLKPGGYDLLPKLAAIRVPTLVIYGNHDMIPEASAVHIAKAIPGARLVRFDNCGHFTFLECPAATRDAIDAFFRAR